MEYVIIITNNVKYDAKVIKCKNEMEGKEKIKKYFEKCLEEDYPKSKYYSTGTFMNKDCNYGCLSDGLILTELRLSPIISD